MIDPYSTDEHTRKSILALLIQLSKVDKSADANELAYITRVAWQLGLQESDIHDISNDLNSYEVTPPTQEKERMTILYYLLFFMNTDGAITIEEEKLVKEFGFRLGFRTNLTRDLIQVIKDHAHTKVPPGKMLEAIKKYLN